LVSLDPIVANDRVKAPFKRAHLALTARCAFFMRKKKERRMSEAFRHLARAAQQAAQQGRWQEAERLWLQVRNLDPGNAEALYSLGVHAMQRGDARGAVGYLQAAHQAKPDDPMFLVMLARACANAGDTETEADALNRALILDPYFLPALLARGRAAERLGRPKQAATLYRYALQAAPHASRWPDWLRGELQHAQSHVKAHAEALAQHLDERLGGAMPALAAAQQERWREAAAILAGQSQPYVQACNQLHIPRLPPIPFYERTHFPWAEALEAKTDVIREELRQALAEDEAGFAPYIGYRPGDPVNQWEELNHSKRWSSYFLWKSGAPIAAHHARCPQTASALTEVDLADIEGLCPNVMFSALAPHTAIPPHHGETNARLVVHLPLIVPAGCHIRVGFERRVWQEGSLLFFDDTLEHEAHNDSDFLRTVLIFDVWNPLLSQEERAMAQATTQAVRAYFQE
jgi:aspartate beta-hydroxylase